MTKSLLEKIEEVSSELNKIKHEAEFVENLFQQDIAFTDKLTAIIKHIKTPAERDVEALKKGTKILIARNLQMRNDIKIRIKDKFGKTLQDYSGFCESLSGQKYDALSNSDIDELMKESDFF
jgi:hypothetical protein